jgi:hypothetical protein
MNFVVTAADNIQALEAYDTQLRHLQKELHLIQQEFEDWEKMTGGDDLDAAR